MSEYAGELKVKLTVDGSDVPAQVNQQMKGVSPRVQGILDRTGLGKQLADVNKAGKRLADSERELGRAAQASSLDQANLGVKIGLLGAAAGIGFQTLRQLSQELRVTGVEAGTTEGRFRNLGASILSGDLIGAFKAVRTEVTLSGTALEALQVQLAKTGDSTGFAKLQAAAKAFGNEKLSAQLSAAQFDVRENLQTDKATAASLTPGLKDDLASAKVAEREAQIGLRIFEQGTAAYSKAFQGYAKAVRDRRGVQEKIKAAGGGGPTDASRDTQYQLNLLRAESSNNEKASLDVSRTRREYLQKQIAVLERDTTKTQEQKQRLTQLYGALASVESSIDQSKEQAQADARERLQKRLALAQTDLSIQLANARGEAQESQAIQAQAAFATKAASDKRLTIEEQKSYELQAAQANRQLYDIQQAQAERAKQAAEDAREQRKRELEAEKQRLADELAADKQRYRETLSLEEQKLQLRVQAAQLTDKNKNDDKRALKKLIAFYKEEEKDRKLTVQERLTARSNEISARLQLRGLAPEKTGQSRALTNQSFFSAAAQQFQTYGSNIAGSGGILSGQDARAKYASRVLSGNGAQSFAQAVEKARSAQATTQISELQRQTALLRRIANGVRRNGPPGPIAYAQAVAKAKATVTGGQ